MSNPSPSDIMQSSGRPKWGVTHATPSGEADDSRRSTRASKNQQQLLVMPPHFAAQGIVHNQILPPPELVLVQLNQGIQLPMEASAMEQRPQLKRVKLPLVASAMEQLQQLMRAKLPSAALAME